PQSYDAVDPLLGGEEALASLARAAQARGLKLIGDVCLDHCGIDHEWFTRARSDPASPEREFFLFDRAETHGFASWRGTVPSPRCDWRSEELRGRMRGVLRRWLETGLDGWRVGAAGVTGRHADVDLNAEIMRWAREQLDGALLVGEYWHDYQPDIDG